MENLIENRYSIIENKNKREIVLLRGKGCVWRKCRFCDYHLDSNKDQSLNDQINIAELDKVTGIYNHLEVINSGSFIDLSSTTIDYIEKVCIKNNITTLHFECHYLHKDEVKPLKDRFKKNNITVNIKIGVETFDYLFRESYLNKGILEKDPSIIASYFDEVCLLQGIPGQTVESMINDIEIGLKYFNRVCVNIMIDNGMPIMADPNVIKIFMQEVYPLYVNNDDIDILLNNTDFGVGNL
ncbi:MAG: radical SAM protein [bacterium]